MLYDKIKKQSLIKKLTKKKRATKKKEWASNMKGKIKGWNWKGKKKTSKIILNKKKSKEWESNLIDKKNWRSMQLKTKENLRNELKQNK
jgi:hypothetical protein